MPPGEELLVGVGHGRDQGKQREKGAEGEERDQPRDLPQVARGRPLRLVARGQRGQARQVGGQPRVGAGAARGQGQPGAQAGQEVLPVTRRPRR